uniref:Uncharacterized protein n=1 Tax=Ralstonia solanacearum TaxID=305 RepID=A0A0S4W472_RALSL|nr:protein of unknown function [Ralstonia solanacearum]CUV36848.1 protein of unknown function [Ralstonia solanacearum]CUV41640.1 protein of unknown function [Ralstonia solanacearum]CUV63425.1 protein of unknown function [Ralstonia solanacearum]
MVGAQLVDDGSARHTRLVGSLQASLSLNDLRARPPGLQEVNRAGFPVRLDDEVEARAVHVALDGALPLFGHRLDEVAQHLDTCVGQSLSNALQREDGVPVVVARTGRKSLLAVSQLAAFLLRGLDALAERFRFGSNSHQHTTSKDSPHIISAEERIPPRFGKVCNGVPCFESDKLHPSAVHIEDLRAAGHKMSIALVASQRVRKTNVCRLAWNTAYRRQLPRDAAGLNVQCDGQAPR